MSTPTFDAPKKRLSKNKKIAIFAVGGLLGLGAIWWYKNRQNAASSSAASTDPGIDPNTGIPYSQENAGAYGTPGNLGGYNPLTGGYNPGPGLGEVFSPTNATWATEAEQYLMGLGYDPITVSTALGLYLAGQPLSQNQYDIVTAAIGFEGNPPNGAPPPILEGGGGSGQGGGPGTTVTVPSIVGARQVTAALAVGSRGLKLKVTHTGEGAKGTGWIIISQHPNGGSKAKVGSTVTAEARPERQKGKHPVPGKKRPITDRFH